VALLVSPLSYLKLYQRSTGGEGGSVDGARRASAFALLPLITNDHDGRNVLPSRVGQVIG